MLTTPLQTLSKHFVG